MVVISSKFDSGSIEVIDASDPADIQLNLVPEPHSELEDETFMQWFHFRVSNVKGVPLTFRVLNAGDSAYPAGWDGYKTAITYDKITWERLPDTSWDEAAGVLKFSVTPTHDTLWLSYFAPFSTERHMQMMARSAASPAASLAVLGESLDGRPIEELTIGGGRAQIWLVCQQHPGEHMASWWVEGLLERLLDPADPIARKLLDQCTFHVVPRMNPDGCARGHLRTNACGANLNREWCPSQKPDGTDYDAPTLAMSPEVYWVLKAMDASGVDCCVDAHGDEGACSINHPRHTDASHHIVVWMISHWLHDWDIIVFLRMCSTDSAPVVRGMCTVNVTGLPYIFFAGNRGSDLYQSFQVQQRRRTTCILWPVALVEIGLYTCG